MSNQSSIPTEEIQVRVAGFFPGNPHQEHLAFDGDYGRKTTLAVKNFQSSHGLVVDGVTGLATADRLNLVYNSFDRSTRHFDWQEFASRDGSSDGKVPVLTAVLHLRWLMCALEAVRRKLGGDAIYIDSGFRSVAHNGHVGGASDSMHMYGLAADVSTRNRTPREVADAMKTSGFSGVKAYTGHTHGDLRARINRSWWWA